mgnify:CR=1 FL=1|jgi:Na+/H+ antiporter NhaD/arsenite permease-like protein
MVALILGVFIVGYAAIAFEHNIKINKAATSLITGVLCWSIYALYSMDKDLPVHQLTEHLGEVAGILFFLMGAMTVVELIDAHDGFEIITGHITTTSKKKLVWIVAFISFFLSAVLDNLTTTIVMVSLLRNLVQERRERLLFIGLVVIAANSGGAWSPIGDVTTTMLWLGGQIDAQAIVSHVIVPSLVCCAVPAFIISLQVKGTLKRTDVSLTRNGLAGPRSRLVVFLLGVGTLMFVPIFKIITNLPPYMGILFGLGGMWLITELIHSEKDEAEKGLLSVNHALRKIDTPSILFFLGILLSVAVLQTTGVLAELAVWLDNNLGNIEAITFSIGALSSIVDNVPLVAAAQGMYSLQQFPTDHTFWMMLAYCAGTGGSMLIIGSAAGVAAMGMEKIDFFWYLKRVGWLALLGYAAGMAVYLLQQYLLA